MNVLLINDSTSNPNWGDRAAATSLMAMIQATGSRITHAISEDDLKRSIFAEGTAVLDGRRPSKGREIAKLYIPPVLLRIRGKLRAQPDDTASPSRLVPERWEDFLECSRLALGEQRHGWPELLSAVAAADVAVIHGDGSMVGNGIVPRTDLFLTYLIKKHFGKPVIIVNHTADFDHPDLRRMAEQIYPLFDDVVFRDPVSAQRCESLCAGRFAADTAFWFEPAPKPDWAALASRPTFFDIWPNKASLDPSEPYVCLGGSSLLWTPSWRPAEVTADFATLVRHLRSVYSGQIVLTASDPAEQMVFETLAAELDLPLIGVTTPLQQAVDVVGNADAYVTGRWHPAIFALRGGAPVIALSAKTFKMQALMRSAGLPETAFDSLALAQQRDPIAGLLHTYLESGSALRSRLQAWGQTQAASSWDNVTYLRHHQQPECGKPGRRSVAPRGDGEVS